MVWGGHGLSGGWGWVSRSTYEKTIDVKTAIESVLALFVVEKMSRSSVRDWPPVSFYSPRKAYLYITDIEKKLGSEIQKLLHVFSFHFYQMLISPSLQRSFVIAEII